MISFTQETTRYTVKPENAQRLRALAAKPPKIKRLIDRKHDAMRRDYPQFYPGMTTGEYLSQYAGLNSRLLLTAHEFTHADRATAMLDPTQPEALEELDPDWTPPAPKASKARRPGPAELRLALSCILDVEPVPEASVHDLWLALGEIRKIAKHMLKS